MYQIDLSNIFQNVKCHGPHVQPTGAADPVLYHEAWKKLCECEGVLVPGGFGKRGVEGKIAATQWARYLQGVPSELRPGLG